MKLEDRQFVSVCSAVLAAIVGFGYAIACGYFARGGDHDGLLAWSVVSAALMAFMVCVVIVNFPKQERS